MILESHIVPAQTRPQRLSDYAVGIFETIPTRKGIKKAIRRGEVLVEGSAGTTGTWVVAGMKLDLKSPEKTSKKTLKLGLKVVLEDPDLAVVFKPGGLPVHAYAHRTLENALLFNLKPSARKDRLPAPLPAHRLDAPTCGLVLIGKTRSALTRLRLAFENRQVEKRYCAVAMGKTPDSAFIRLPIDDKDAQTRFRRTALVPSNKNGHLSMLDIQLLTGRKHQIRRHLAGIGHAVLGDRLYSPKGKVFRGKGLFLCATGLVIHHPRTGKRIEAIIDPPSRFFKRMEREREMYYRKHGSVHRT